MTRKHKDALIRLFPNMKSKIYTLKEYAEGKNTKDYFGKDIADNYDFTLIFLILWNAHTDLQAMCAI